MRAFAQRTALIQHMCQRRWDFGMARTLRLGAALSDNKCDFYRTCMCILATFTGAVVQCQAVPEVGWNLYTGVPACCTRRVR